MRAKAVEAAAAGSAALGCIGGHRQRARGRMDGGLVGGGLLGSVERRVLPLQRVITGA